jgi:predicted CXXCH cytochrome family protein
MASLPGPFRRILMCALFAAGVLSAAAFAIQASSNGADKAIPLSKSSSSKARPAPANPTTDGYIDSAVCAGCHQEIARSYVATGMGQSFRSVDPGANSVAFAAQFDGARVDNQASGMTYQMVAHDGKLFERRSQTDAGGEEINIVEEQVDDVIGSGNHARTFLHRDAQGRLIELPVSWYTEGGGYWAMSPGFDRRDQEDFRRAIPAECMFCHNGYPQPIAQFNPAKLDPPAFPQKLPQGIDCQRCHGPGADHVRAVISGASIEEIRRAIVNPARLDRERQLDICMECHLETSSSHMPNEIRLYDRSVFSFRPGQPLGEYKLYFDPLANRPDDRFEIAHQAYRLRMSACFKNSQMTCLTCHDPHQSYRGTGSTERYIKVCESCHQGVTHTTSLPQASTCLDCHMPKRRTDDAVHVVMTDHYIQRGNIRGTGPDRDLTAPFAEGSTKPPSKTGIALYYPAKLPDQAERELYLAVAEVKDGSTGAQAIARLLAAIQRYSPSAPEFYLELARGYAKAGNNEQAIRWYEEALRRKPDSDAVAKDLADLMLSENHAAQAETVLRLAAAKWPGDVQLIVDLGDTSFRQGHIDAARAEYLHALAVNPFLPEAENMLGLIAIRQKNRQEAEKWLRAAVRDDPALVEAHYNLGDLLSGEGGASQAESEFRRAIAIDPNYGAAHHGLGLMLELNHDYDQALTELELAAHLDAANAEAHGDLADLLAARGQLPEAEAQYRAAIQLKPDSIDLHASLGGVLEAQGKADEAIAQFETVVKLDPAVYPAQMELAGLLAKAGRTAEARAHCAIAAKSPDAKLRSDALGLLKQLGG